MRTRRLIYILLAFLAVIMLAIACRFLFILEKPLLNQVTFCESVCGLTVNPYHDMVEDVYYLFVPSYAGIENMEVKSSNFLGIDFSDENTDYGNDIRTVPLSDGITLTLTLTNFYQEETYTLKILQGQNLSTLYIETESGSMDYVNADRDNEEDATVLVVNADGSVEFSDSTVITGRGNVTWTQGVKKPYNLKFSHPTDLIGIGTAETWCLLANYSDASQIRGDTSYYIAREFGIEYTTDTAFVSVYINGDYFGLYNVATKKAYTEAGDISVFEQTDSGNYIHDYITDNGTYIRYRYGDEDTIRSAVSKLDYLLLENQDISYEQISETVDVESFARKYLVEKIIANYDIFKGQYFSVDPSGKISAICAWDYDLTFGGTWNKYYDTSFNSVNLSYTGISTTNAWYDTLFQYEEFRDELLSLLDQYRNFLSTDLPNYIDSCCNLIQNDWTLNRARWQNEEPFASGNSILKTDRYDLTTLDGNRQYILDFIQNRCNFLEAYIRDPDSFCTLTFSDDTVGSCAVYCVPGSTVSDVTFPDGLLTIDETGFLGWYTEDSVSITNVEEITGDMVFYGRWEEVAAAENEPEPEPVEELEAGSDTSLLKRVYHALGLNSFSRGQLVLFGTFCIVLLMLIIGLIWSCIRRLKENKGNKDG